MLRTRCGRQGKRRSHGGSVRASGRGRFVCKSGWVGGFPEGDASSRWLIDIRTDLFPRTTTTIAAMISMRLQRARAIRLAELARLIGQTDPFGSMGRANQQVQPRAAATRDPYQNAAEPMTTPAAGPPPWMQRAARQEAPPQEPTDYPERGASAASLRGDSMPRLRRIIIRHRRRHLPMTITSRIRRAMTMRCTASSMPARSRAQHDPAYSDDPYAYQDGYDDGAEDQRPKRRGGMVTVMVVLALAVIGTGAAFAYRTYIGSPRSGEPPIIKADTSPTKIVPAPADANAKVPDRLAAGDGTEKIVPREEAPVDVNAKAGPRVVFPPLNQNANPPSAASVAPSGRCRQPMPATARCRTTSRARSRRSRFAATSPTVPPCRSLRAAKPAAKHTGLPRPRRAPRQRRPMQMPRPMRRCRCRRRPPRRLLRNPEPGWPPTTPVQIAPQAASGSGGYLVQVSSQRNEADAQASYRALQGKFPAVLGSHSARDQARRSRRKGRLLPRHGRSVRLARGSLAVLRQPEKRRRTVRRPKELTAVSLTLVPSAG